MSNAPYTVDQHTLIWGLFRQIKSTFWIEYFGLKVMFNTRFLAVVKDLNACNFISYQNGFNICKHSRVMCNLQLQCPTHPTFPYVISMVLKHTPRCLHRICFCFLVPWWRHSTASHVLRICALERLITPPIWHKFLRNSSWFTCILCNNDQKIRVKFFLSLNL